MEHGCIGEAKVLETILTYDMGGSSLRVALFDLNGRCVDMERQALSMEMDSQGGCQADPDFWWESFVSLAGNLLTRAGAGTRVRAVCGSGMTRSQVFLDHGGKPLFPAILWPDHRAGKEGRMLAGMADKGEYWSEFNAFHTFARILWFKATHPDLFFRTAVVLEPKDYINFRLTGKAASDRISLCRILTVQDLSPATGLMEKAGVPPSLFPKLLWPWQVVGNCPSLPAPLSRLVGVPVLAGGMDTWCAVTGTGALEGDIYNVSGTSEVTGLITREKVWREGLVTLPWGEGRFQVGGPSQVGGDAVKWMGELFTSMGRETGSALENGPDPAGITHLADLAEARPRGWDAPLFLPYLRGERAPLWDDRARGCFWNLRREHDGPDLVRAVMEGVAMANRYLLETLFQDRPFSGQVIISGGASKSDLWCRIKADVIGLPVVRRNTVEAGLTGAFILGLAAIGRIGSLDEGCRRIVETDQVFEPDPHGVLLYNRLYPHWKKVSLSMLAFHREMPSEIL